VRVMVGSERPHLACALSLLSDYSTTRARDGAGDYSSGIAIGQGSLLLEAGLLRTTGGAGRFTSWNSPVSFSPFWWP